MKNIFVIAAASLLSSVVLAGDFKVPLRGDINDKGLLHTAALAEKFLAKNRLSHITFETVPGLDEARKNCDSCLQLERMRRLILDKAPLVRISSENKEWYDKSCPQDVYQEMSDEMLYAYMDAPQAEVQDEAAASQNEAQE